VNRISDPHAAATRPRGALSVVDRGCFPISCIPNVPFEQVCGDGDPLSSNNILHLPHPAFVRPDTEADRVQPISEVLKRVGSTSHLRPAQPYVGACIPSHVSISESIPQEGPSPGSETINQLPVESKARHFFDQVAIGGKGIPQVIKV
jgi:hypothetical protein